MDSNKKLSMLLECFKDKEVDLMSFVIKYEDQLSEFVFGNNLSNLDLDDVKDAQKETDNEKITLQLLKDKIEMLVNLGLENEIFDSKEQFMEFIGEMLDVEISAKHMKVNVGSAGSSGGIVISGNAGGGFAGRDNPGQLELDDFSASEG